MKKPLKKFNPAGEMLEAEKKSSKSDRFYNYLSLLFSGLAFFITGFIFTLCWAQYHAGGITIEVLRAWYILEFVAAPLIAAGLRYGISQLIRQRFLSVSLSLLMAFTAITLIVLQIVLGAVYLGYPLIVFGYFPF